MTSTTENDVAITTETFAAGAASARAVIASRCGRASGTPGSPRPGSPIENTSSDASGRVFGRAPIARFASSRRCLRRVPADAGFTLVEILLVVAILTSLAALVLIGGKSLIEGTKARATRALFERLVLHLDEYRSVTGYYPPDGIDSPVTNDEGERVQGSAALYHALTTPIEVSVMTGGIPRVVKRDALTKFGDGEISEPDEDYPGVREILDAFGDPIHYDNTFDGQFRPQGGEVHYPPLEDHPLDPREVEESQGGVANPGQVQSRTYDMWSYGKRGHDMELEPSPPIATWNLKE